MATPQSSPVSFVDRKKQETLDRISKELADAQASGKPFAKMSHHFGDGDPNIFFQNVVDIANAMNPRPYAIAPFYGEGVGRDPHSTAVACGVIISF